MDLTKILYNGKYIPDVCEERNASFEEFDKRFHRMRKNKKLDIYSDDYLIDYIFRNFYPEKPRTNSPFSCKYFVDDDKISDFARQNGMLPFSVREAVQKGLLKNPNEDVSKLAKDFVARNKDRIVYMYDNYPLSIALKKLNINRSTIMNVFYEECPDYKNMSQSVVNAVIKEIVDTHLKNRDKREKAKRLKYEI